MLHAPCYVIADAHIGYAPPDVERALIGFLEARRDAARRGVPGSLLIDGDIFEFWYEWHTVIPRPAFRVLAAVAALRDAGTDVLWIAGNHDCWGGDVLRRDVGVEYHVGPWVGDVAGWRARVEHGDGPQQTLLEIMKEGGDGMQHFDGEIEKLVRSGIADIDTALNYATDRQSLQQALGRI